MTITVNTRKGLVPTLFPTGGIIAWGGKDASPIPPVGWLVCNGTTVAQGLYKRLFNVIGTSYNTGGEPVGTFRLPNLVDKCIYGGNAVSYGGIQGHEHLFTTATTIGLVASGDHTHVHNRGGSSMSNTGNGTHVHNSQALNAGSNSGSNASKATGARAVQGSAHGHVFGVDGVLIGGGNHNHNSNTSNTSGGGGNHELSHYPNANASTRVSQASFDAFGPAFNEDAGFNENLAANFCGIIKT